MAYQNAAMTNSKAMRLQMKTNELRVEIKMTKIKTEISDLMKQNYKCIHIMNKYLEGKIYLYWYWNKVIVIATRVFQKLYINEKIFFFLLVLRNINKYQFNFSLCNLISLCEDWLLSMWDIYLMKFNVIKLIFFC